MFLGFSSCAENTNNQGSFIYTGIQSTLSETIDTYLDTNLDNNSPGLSILIRDNGVEVYSGNRGLANRHTNTSISSDTGFRLASVSKSFTAIAIMQLQEQGLLKLDDRLLSYIPELPESWQPITIHHLLSHQSGIPDFINDSLQIEDLDGLSNDDIVSYYSVNEELEFTPGTQGEYSNTGYLLLAEVIEAVTGATFAEHMREAIFEPAGMTNSYITNKNIPLREGDALNYADRDTFLGINLYTYGSMAQVSSAKDLGLFAQALSDNSLVTAETLALMLTSHAMTREGASFGYGTSSGTVFGHLGAWDGFRTTLVLDRETTFELMILGNGGDDTSTHTKLIRGLLWEFYSEKTNGENPG